MKCRSLFVTIFTITCTVGLAAQMPRDRLVSPRETGPSAAESALIAKIAAAPSDPALRLELAKLQEDAGRYADAESTLMTAKAVLPSSIPLLQGIAGFYNRQGDFDKTVAHLEDAARLDPSNPAGHHMVGAFYQEKAAKDFRLSEPQKRAYIEAGIAAEDTALALQPDYVEALVYKNILLRMLASTDAANRERLIAEADALRNRAMARQKQALSPTAPTSPRPPAASPGQAMSSPPAPVRVGGNIRMPRKTRHVDPIYPQDAVNGRVQGVIICEVVVETTGLVRDVKILRSIPLLDAAALEAVHQWEFEPTYLNGMPVPVIMTVTVNFTLE